MSFPRKQDDMTLNMSFTVKNVPSPSNGHVGIVEGSIVYDTVCISDFGIANAESANSNHPEDILNKAREQAKQKLLQREPPPYSAPAQRQSFPTTDTSTKAKTNGGGTKPASAKQIEMIANKCSKLGQNPDKVCRDICGKALNELLGQDAHMVIQKLV